MNLPPLPDPGGALFEFRTRKAPFAYHTADDLREYGALCRKMALEEAAQVCEDYPAPLSCNRLEATLWDVATTSCAAKIRELK